MARTLLAVQVTSLTGLAATLSAVPGTGANNGVEIPNDGDTMLAVRNAGASACTVTLDATGVIGGVPLSDPTPSCPNDSATRYYGPFDPSAFGGVLGVDFSLATGVTIAAIRVPRP